MVERVTRMSLEQYFQQNIWTPLQMQDSTFRLHERPDLKERIMDMTMREGLIHPVFGTTMSPDGNIVHGSEGNKNVKVVDDYGGAGVYCSAIDYAKLLRTLCLNDGKLLKHKSVDMMFTPQLGEGSKLRLSILRGLREVNNGFGGLPNTNEPMDFGLGGMMAMEDVPRRRSRGSIFWGGLPNLFWWMDRENGVSGIMATQLVPSGDPKCVEYMGKFEEGIYELMNVEGERTRSREKL
jgi:CubicO group peptidase (beta-lactamase class C family)